MLKALTYANKKTYSKTASGTSLMCMIKIRVPRYFLVEYQIPLGEDKNDFFSVGDARSEPGSEFTTDVINDGSLKKIRCEWDTVPKALLMCR